MSTKDPRDVVAEFDRAGEDGDVEALKAVCHPLMLTHSLGPTMPQGIEGVRKFVARRTSSGAGGRWVHVVTVAQGEYVTGAEACSLSSDAEGGVLRLVRLLGVPVGRPGEYE